MTLKEASLNLTEEAYRDLPLLSYSSISRYDREGYGCVATLLDHISSPSLTFGSLVDCLLTQEPSVFSERYVILDMQLPPAPIILILEMLLVDNKSKQLSEIPDKQILEAANITEYQKNWKDDTKVNKIRELGSNYFNFLVSAGDKEVIPIKDYEAAQKAVENLKTNLLTSNYFNDTPFQNVEHLYQLQFKAIEDTYNIPYKVMLDLVMIDHDNKTITPCDLKTTKSIYSFEDSFYKFRYYIQASMYTNALQYVIKESCPELIDYKIKPYKFIVIDRNVFQPIVFEWKPIEIVRDPQGQLRKCWRDLLADLQWACTNIDKQLPKDWYYELLKTSAVKLPIYYIDENGIYKI